MRNQEKHHKWRWYILALVGIAQLMVVLDTTIVNIALPSAQKALHFSNSDRQWVVTAYALAFGSLLLLGGRLGDRFGRKRTFVVGLLGFAGASGVGGAANSFEMLVGARALQGAFGALLAPSALGLLTTTFTDPGERGKAFGIYGAISGGGAAVGLLLGGVLTEYVSWRACMYVNLVFAIPTAIGATLLLRHQGVAEKRRIDLPGAVTVCLGLFALVYGFSNAETHSWGNGLTVGMLSAAVVLLISFITLQSRGKHPLLPLRLVIARRRGSSYLAIFISGLGMFGVFLFLTYYLQQTLGFSPVQTGVAFLPLTVAVVACSTTSNILLLPRFGPRLLVAPGLALAALGMVLLTRLSVHSSYAPDVLPPLMIIGAGMGLTFGPAANTATTGVARTDAGVASALVNTMQQVGGSIGTSLLSTLAASATSSYMHGKPRTPDVVSQAAVYGDTIAFWISAGVFALGAVVCATLFPRGVTELAPDAEPVPAH